MTEPLLRLDAISRDYGSRRVVDQVSIDIHPGARHALIGPNGAGKSTLINLVAGTLHPTTGRIHYAGCDIHRWPPHRRARAGIARTWQHPALATPLTALQNVLVAVPGQHPATIRPHPRAVIAAHTTLAQVGLTAYADTPAGQLAYGDQRRLEIAVALAGRPRLLLLDEPSAGLTRPEVAHLVDLIRDLPAEMAVLLVDHNLHLVTAACDTITVLHHGAQIATGTPAHVQADPEVRRIYLSQPSDDAEPADPAAGHDPGPATPAKPVLRVRHLHAGHHGATTLTDITLDLHPGRVTAVVGRNGAGKTTLINTVAGLHPATAPTDILLHDQQITGLSARRRARAGIGLVPQGRRLFAGLTVDEHLALPRPHRTRRHDRTPADVLALFPGLADRRRHRPHQLSGGEQQMLALARALLAAPAVLLLDEPSEGLAPAIIDTLALTIRTLATSGTGVLLAEQNLHLALRVADEIAVLDHGTIALHLSADEARTVPARLHDLLVIPAGSAP
ncbi:ATP-binding cassette domain-containing protein [Micromonospora sp. WMMD1102]|uniref:ATP-binding cassette domain-containing protein n=1 Tax=Micromonospora sp. WMMD1102 TaxID=3016105 RepID=UPI0024158186|nr:ATP-binding cassette domain-containing protein [Micromonospora sp. WMMD1102]MDG4784990.1 ATP-binding cassette domain-containing protein [Micromonospora sp. WMMD1102]